MNRAQILRVGCAALAASALAACGGADPDQGDAGGEGTGEAEGTSAHEERVVVEDHQGRRVELPDPPQRLLSLVPSATEILRDLGAEERLVGRTDFDTAAALDHLPSVGGGLEPSMEQVVTLAPDLVVRFDAESDPATPRRLDDAGIPHVAVRPDGLQEVEEMVRMMGHVVARPGEAEVLWREIEDDLDAVRNTFSGKGEPVVALLLGGDPPLAAGPGTFLADLLEVTGARNAFSDLESLYPPVSREELSARGIDRVVAPEGAELPSLPPGIEVRRVPGWIQRPGPRLADAALELARAVHGGERGG